MAEKPDFAWAYTDDHWVRGAELAERKRACDWLTAREVLRRRVDTALTIAEGGLPSTVISQTGVQYRVAFEDAKYKLDCNELKRFPHWMRS